MSHVTVWIGTDNAAFQDGAIGSECARILRSAADMIDNVPVLHDGNAALLFDANGNRVGEVTVTE